MKQTKKEMQKKIDDRQLLIQKYCDELNNRDSEINSLKQDVATAEGKADSFEKQLDDNVDLIDNIVKILAGTSNKISKAEVIEDLLAMPVHQLRVGLSHMKDKRHIHEHENLKFYAKRTSNGFNSMINRAFRN